MVEEKHTVQSFFSLGVVLVMLLTLTSITVFVTELHLGAFSVGVALLIASTKAFIVLSYFMHLKYEKRFTKIMVGGVFLLYALVVIITFFDYLFR